MCHFTRILVIATLSVMLYLPSTVAQNENGGARISFGEGNEFVEPRTLSGDDPAVPQKPKRTFSTNSIILNQILQSCDEGFDSFNKIFKKLQEIEKITLGTEDNSRECFSVVYNFDTSEIKAVMDKGTGKRMNLLNNQFETDEKYPSDVYKKIYFLINE